MNQNRSHLIKRRFTRLARNGRRSTRYLAKSMPGLFTSKLLSLEQMPTQGLRDH